MTEPKRATWTEFATFMASRCSWPTTEGAAMWRAVPLLRSKRDAQIAYAAAYGYGDEDFERDVAAWVGSLRSQGIEPPADPPSVVEVLESVAIELDSIATAFADSQDRGEAHGVRVASRQVRTKAKEFT